MSEDHVTEQEAEDRNRYLRGRSLFFMRMIARLPPKYGDCNAAIADLAEHNALQSVEHEPRLGSLIWFSNDFHGDVAMYLDNGHMLVLDQGRPMIVNVTEDSLSDEATPWGSCEGWSDGY